MATPNSGGSGQLTQAETKSSFNPRQPGNRPGCLGLNELFVSA